MSNVLMERKAQQLSELESRELLGLNEVLPSYVRLEEEYIRQASDVLQYVPTTEREEELLLCAICGLLQEHHKFENFDGAGIGSHKSVLENRFIGFRIEQGESWEELISPFDRDFETTLQSCIHRKMIQETPHDEWRPGMKSGTGFRNRYTVTPLGKWMVRESVFKASEPKSARTNLAELSSPGGKAGRQFTLAVSYRKSGDSCLLVSCQPRGNASDRSLP